MRIGKKLRNKITYIKKLDAASLIIVLAMFLVLIAGIFVVSNNYKENQEELIEDAMKLQSQSHKEKFEAFIEEKVESLKGIASFPAVTSMSQKKQRELLKNRADELGFLHLFVMDTKGQGYYIDEDITKDQSTEPFFYNISSNHVYITEPFYGQDQTFTTVCVSIFDIKLEKIGTLCGAVKLDSLKGVLAESETLLDGELLLVNREGTYIYAKDMQKVYDKLKIYDESKSDYDLVTQAFDSKKDQMGDIKIGGKEYKAHVTYLADYDWAIIQCVEKDKIFENLKYIDVVKYGALLIVVVLVVCVSRIAIHWRASQRRINTDTLTGCNSRAAMEALIDNADKAVDQDITLIYLDLNKFKYVNDTYGHEVGDKVLCVYSKSLMKIFGRIGFVGRMGGDEFMVILAGVKKDVALKLCQKLESILVEDSKQLDFDYTISTSYGIATRLKGSYTPIEDLMVEADERMYNFKEEHR
ncbi:MAG: GGDEF domain-containing protein [Lachnospiraceae bacterium]|nr:GGDEF domain-containing protein [Lachnospiraceae bacterium]